MDADALLARYHDWRDSSAWPTSVKVDHAIQTAAKKQGDPLDKPGVVGAWCRTYTITDVLEGVLADVYEPTAQPDRWTLRGGSTSGGLVVYDNKFAYSHHGTDDTSMQLCNAFDLVRIHLGSLDDGSPAKGINLPSYKAMVELATKDPAVRHRIVSERADQAKEAFGETVDADDEPTDDRWMAELDVDRKGNISTTIKTLLLILQNDPNLRGRFAHNAFTKKDVVFRHLPWRDLTSDSRYFTDVDLAGLRDYLERTYQLSNASKTADALALALHASRFHPVRDYLDTLAWDGQERLETLLIDYLGAEDLAYTRAVTRKTLVAAVARVMRPGIKFDYVLTLVGRQGAGKSTLIKRLGRDWYCENLTTVQGKEAAEQLHGVWLMEMGELAGLRKAEVEIIKNFISRTEDSYRPAYGIKKETYPRQCVFIGTTNNEDFLRDATGNRRFWPIKTGVQEPTLDIFTDLDDAAVGQIWAEAVQMYESNENLYLSKDDEAAAQVVQEQHREVDDRFGRVQKYLDTWLPDNWDSMNEYARRSFLSGDDLTAQGTTPRNYVCVAEIWVECLSGRWRT